MTQAAAAYVVHRLPGRLRLRIPSRRGDRRYFSAVETRLRNASDQTANIVANPYTASLLIEGVAALEAAQDLLTVAENPPVRPLAGTLRDGWRRLDDGVVRATQGAAGAAEMAIVILLSLAVVQSLRGRTLGPASQMIWNAYSVVRQMVVKGE